MPIDEDDWEAGKIEHEHPQKDQVLKILRRAHPQALEAWEIAGRVYNLPSPLDAADDNVAELQRDQYLDWTRDALSELIEEGKVESKSITEELTDTEKTGYRYKQ